ncbi:ubiquinol-cytochrome c reductase iron-sulfur subunit N-terminal domain-containing protein, partial [Acinetobacter baumannii]
DPSRRDFIHIAAVAGTAGGVAALAWPLVDQMNPSGDTLALATVEYDFSKVALGQQVSINWRGKPVFIRHRTPAEIAAARADD